MILHQTGTTIGLLLTTLPVLVGIWLYTRTPYKREALHWLLGGALLVRLLMIALDPYLQDWDERFHALVARNMMSDPFRPMLFAHPVFPYGIDEWWNSHIWVHKQPLFLWQMALSMKILGVGTFALRLPSAILGAIMVKMIHDIGLRWTRNADVAFLSALLATTSWYTLEMISGWNSLEHNDLAMTFYVTAGVWAWMRGLDSEKKWKWAVITGVFVGCAVLVKWLTAFLVFGGWGLYLLMSPALRLDRRAWLHLFTAFGVSVMVFLPWQLYILRAFPEEAAISFAYNRLHILKDLGHEGPWYFHIKFLGWAYAPVILIAMAAGLFALPWKTRDGKAMTIAMTGMIVVIYAFFAYVATKMPGFVHPVSGLLIILCALGAMAGLNAANTKLSLSTTGKEWLTLAFFLVLAYASMMPARIVKHRHAEHAYRERKLHNTEIYRKLSPDITHNYIVINCRNHENIELMFWQGGTANAFYPEQPMLDSLKQLGYRFAAFDYDDEQKLPAYIVQDPEIIMLVEKTW
jgi:4-amino-4-deoxy-L-arabinose transferase